MTLVRKGANRARAFSYIVAAGTVAVAGFSGSLQAQEKQEITIGYAVSLSGPAAAGTGITTLPNYALWQKELAEQGGITLPDGRKLPVRFTVYDDRSSAEEAVRAVERLATQDKVDFILPPWSTGFNLAVAPIMNRYNYPHLAVTSVTDKAPQLAKRWKNSFWFLGGGKDYATALAETLADQRDAGKINNKVAAFSVADGFGIDLIKAARKSFKAAGMELVYDKTYPLGTNNFVPMLNEAKTTGADSFVAFSYPPGTIAMTAQAQVQSFNPEVFYVGVGGAFPVFQKVHGQNVNGVMSIGGVNHADPKIQEYFSRHIEGTGKAPDSWASTITYASLQVLQQAIERKGLDREAVIDEISNGTFETILGTTKLADNQLRDLWWLGQWQNGKFVAVSPSDRDGAADVVIPKPDWKK